MTYDYVKDNEGHAIRIGEFYLHKREGRKRKCRLCDKNICKGEQYLGRYYRNCEVCFHLKHIKLSKRILNDIRVALL